LVNIAKVIVKLKVVYFSRHGIYATRSSADADKPVRRV